MKKSNYLSAAIIMLIIGIFSAISCSTNPSAANHNGNGKLKSKSIDNRVLKLPVSSGEVGVKLDTRSIFKKGYEPSYISLDIGGSLSSFSNNHLSVDPNTNLAILKIKKDTLSQKQTDEAKSGPMVHLKVYDSHKNKLTDITINSLPLNGEMYEVKTNKPKVRHPLRFNPDVPYLIQESASTNPDGKRGVLAFSRNPQPLWLVLNDYNKDNVKKQGFYLIPADKNDAGNDSTFYIKSAFEAGVSKYYLYVYSGGSVRFKKGPANNNDYKFIIMKEDSGWISIRPKTIRTPIEDKSGMFSVNHHGNTKPAKFRIINPNIKWNVADIGTEFNQPIMPPQHLDLAVANQLTNCTPGSLSQTIGTDKTLTTTTTASSSEGFQMVHSNKTSVSVGTKAKVEASFFGLAGASEEIDMNYKMSFGTSMTNTKKQTFEHSKQIQKTISTKRTVTVAPHTGENVFDAMETYNNVKIPFVQKLRVAGSYNNTALTGKEIRSQLMENQFGGAVTKIGSSYVIISIRGTVKIDKFLKTKSNAVLIPGACDDQ